MSDSVTEFGGEIDTEFASPAETTEEIGESLDALGDLETVPNQECMESLDELPLPDLDEISDSISGEASYSTELTALDSVSVESFEEITDMEERSLCETDALGESADPLMTLSLDEVQDIVGSEKDIDTLRNLRDKIESGAIAVISGENSDEGCQLTLQPQSYTREIR